MKRYLLLLIGSLLLFCMPAMAQGDTTKKGLDAFKQLLAKPDPLADSLAKYNYELTKQRLQTDLAQERYFQKQFDFYYTSSLQHRFDTFQWQQVSGKIIFWVVIVIVFIALLFAAIQFRISMRMASGRTKKAASTGEAKAETVETAEAGAGAAAMPASEVELSMSGLKVNSSVLGVVILVISLAFLYLYLIYVYPINSVKTEEFKNPGTEQVE